MNKRETNRARIQKGETPFYTSFDKLRMIGFFPFILSEFAKQICIEGSGRTVMLTGFLVICGFCCNCLLAEQTVEVTIAAQSFQALKLVCIADGGARSTAVARQIGTLLSVGDQFAVTVKTGTVPTSKKELAELAQQKFALACFITQEDQGLSWRLYDVFAAQLLSGKKVAVGVLSDTELAMHIADQLWYELTSQSNSYASLIAACKKIAGRGPGKRRLQRALCLIHPFLSFSNYAPVVLVDNGNNFAPRWHKTRSVIFYSQHMPTNIRLMSIDPQLSRHVITNFEGQNMTPAIATDGTVVLALSVADSVQLFLYQFDTQAKRGIFTQLTHENGDCVSPSFVTGDQVVFCRIDSANKPRLGILTLSTRKIAWLPIGAAVCPMANFSGTAIAYCKKIAGVYQIFVYDVASRNERQLTRDTGHKDECSWSPCGNYIACSVERGSTSRIAVVCVTTGHIQFVTPAGEHWSSPCWSPHLTLPFSFGKKHAAVLY